MEYRKAEQYVDIMKKSPLFNEIDNGDILSTLDCMGFNKTVYEKDEYIVHEGDIIPGVGLLLEGSLLIMKEDYWGNRTLLTKIMPSGLFGEAFACTKDCVSSVSVITDEKSVICYLDVSHILTTCSNSCNYHNRLITNLVHILAYKNVILSEKIEHMSQRKLRDKILSYLSQCSKTALSNTFVIPFDRQELADYLCVDRSALSAELSKLQREGLIKYNKSSFTLI